MLYFRSDSENENFRRYNTNTSCYFKSKQELQQSNVTFLKKRYFVITVDSKAFNAESWVTDIFEYFTHSINSDTGTFQQRYLQMGLNHRFFVQ